MSRRLWIGLNILVACWGTARAQWDVQFSDYTALKSFYNPAVSGTDGLLNVAGTYSMQMLGYKGAPATMYFGADCPVYFLNPHHGAGVSFMNDRIGMFNTTKIAIQYAYNIKLGKKSRLAIGLQGAMLSESIDPSGVELLDTNDPAFPSSKTTGSRFDMGAGLYFYHPKYFIGASGQHLLAPTIVMGEKNEVKVERVYYLMGGCNIKLKNTLFSLAPSFLVQSDLQSWREDVQCKVYIEFDDKKLYAGVGYSPTISTTFMVGGVFHGIRAGYSYQLYTSGIGALNGSHEVVVGYQTNLDLFKKGRNRHKSVRWL
jgi:type IX secretion system PorP/SprF family membrane protein